MTYLITSHTTSGVVEVAQTDVSTCCGIQLIGQYLHTQLPKA